MENMQNKENRPVNPRRRKRTKMEIFKESYLPVIIVGFTVLFILVTIIGSAIQGSKRKQAIEEETAKQESIAAEEERKRLAAEAFEVLNTANTYAASYNYAEAITALEGFSGNLADFPQLNDAHRRFTAALETMVAWEDPSQVVNLSFQLLIADPARAFVDKTYGNSYNRNFVTIDEFRLILDQLYNNGYILVSLDDIVELKETDGVTQYAAKTLYLPEGKKPLILTQTHVNYNIFMTDGNGDKLPDKNGAGFASKLILDESGKLVNEYIDSEGNTLTGEYDLVPILNSFIATHPDFSYCGAKAIIAVTGYDGLFGYRTNTSAAGWQGAEVYAQQIEGAKKIAQALRDDGYDIACYTYENKAYGKMTTAQMQADLKKWNDEVVPILGTVDIMAFAQISDISGQAAYSGEKFDALMDSGFRYYLGFCTNGTPWASIGTDHFRQARILVTGSNMKYNAGWFEGIFDPSTVLTDVRGNIPQ